MKKIYRYIANEGTKVDYVFIDNICVGVFHDNVLNTEKYNGTLLTKDFEKNLSDAGFALLD